MIKLTSREIYEKLINDGIFKWHGHIGFCMGNVYAVVKNRDVVGDIMRNWVDSWLRMHNVEYAPNDNTQMSPDFYLDVDDKTKELIEIRAFNYKSIPDFDIASFDIYEKVIKDKPYVLDTSYLIFGYIMDDEGVITVKKLWNKKIWEICAPMKSKNGIEWPINLQIENGDAQKIRPVKWYVRQTKYGIFHNLTDFLAAIDETIFMNAETHKDSSGWKQKMEENYEKFFGKKIDISRWDDIKDKYVVE